MFLTLFSSWYDVYCIEKRYLDSGWAKNGCKFYRCVQKSCFKYLYYICWACLQARYFKRLYLDEEEVEKKLLNSNWISKQTSSLPFQEGALPWEWEGLLCCFIYCCCCCCWAGLCSLVSINGHHCMAPSKLTLWGSIEALPENEKKVSFMVW